MSNEWLDVIIDGRMVQINGKGEIREISDDKPKNQIGFRASDNPTRGSKNDVCTECRNQRTEEYCQSRKPGTLNCVKGNKS